MDVSTNNPQKPNLLLYFSFFSNSFGGGEYLPLLFMKELQPRYNITLALDWIENDLSPVLKAYDIDLDTADIKCVKIKPKSAWACRIDSVIPIFSVPKLRKLAQKADLCISCANMIDFGKPAHHFIYILNRFGDNAFIDFFQHAKPLTGFPLFKRRLRTWLAETILRPFFGVRSARKLLADPQQKYYPTSEYVSKVMHAFYGDFYSELFYPPTIFECDGQNNPVRDPLKIVYIGRITPQKKILEIIDMVDKARKTTGKDLHLSLAGGFFEPDYAEQVKAKAAELPWLELVGEIYREEKRQFLLSGTYALHACKEEAFGISIVEYLKAGLVPIVPMEGGACEIVNEPTLTYDQDEEAAQILTKLVNSPELTAQMARHCQERADFFSAQAYLERQTALLNKIAP